MDQAGLAQYLVGREPEAIIRTLAMMAYSPAIGRVLCLYGLTVTDCVDGA